jgi:predicted aspartyl protease
MPCVSYQRPNLWREGPTISVIVRPSTAFLTSLKEQGREIDAKGKIMRAQMLVDTGASGSAVDSSLIHELGLLPTGAISIATPSHENHEVLTYDIDLIIEQNNFTIQDIQVFATGLNNQGIQGLIGRDVLQHMLLVYNGYSGNFTLAV